MKLSIAGLALAITMIGGAGCHSGKATTTTPPAPTAEAALAGPTCDAVADHMRDEMVKAAAEGSDTTDITRLVPVFRRVVAEHCVADAWSADARTCLNTATGEGMNACEGKITKQQNDSMSKAVDAAFNEELMKPGAQSKSMAAPPAPPDDPCGGKE